MERDSTGRFAATRNAEASSSYATAGVLSLLGGAAMGAVAMYLMDPKHGQLRRASAYDTASRALGSTSDAARSACRGTAQALGGAWQSVASRVLPSRDDIQDAGQGLLDRARDLRSSAADSVSSAADSVMNSARNLIPQSLRREEQPDHAINPIGVSLIALGMLGLGASAMWLFDPSKGRARRAWIGQKATRVRSGISTFSHATGRHLRDKAKGYYHETRSAVGDLAHTATEE